MIKYENQGLFIRAIRDITFHPNGRTIESWREYRPWVRFVWRTALPGILLGALISFCIWLSMVVQIAGIELQ